MSHLLRERIIEAASRRTVAEGWSGVTMGRIATDVGVSRQTVHAEVGTKGELAQALVLAELESFLERAGSSFRRHPDDLVAAIEDAVASVLGYAAESPLLRAVISATHGADTDLLPLLTTRPETLLDAARGTVLELVEGYALTVAPSRVEATVEVLVRTVLSQVMYPTAAPTDTAEHLAWLVGQVLAAHR